MSGGVVRTPECAGTVKGISNLASSKRGLSKFGFTNTAFVDSLSSSLVVDIARRGRDNEALVIVEGSSLFRLKFSSAIASLGNLGDSPNNSGNVDASAVSENV